MSGTHPRIWVLLGERRGDNNQLLALAEGLGLPFETRSLRYRRAWGVLLRLFPTGPKLLDAASRATLRPPWPDLVIGIGRRSVPVARWIRERSGRRAKLVRIGNPRADPRLFDLVITTAQYPVPPSPNVLVLPLAMGRHSDARPSAEEAAWLDALPRPHLLFSIGGATRYWAFPSDGVGEIAAKLAERAAAAGGSLIVAPSPRTPPDALEAIGRRLDRRPNCRIAKAGEVRFPVLLNDADEHAVTADSVSMISEAVLTGKPVGLVPVEPDAEGQRKLQTGAIRDIRRFWHDLQQRRLVGTVERPARGAVQNPVAISVAAVRRLLGNGVE